MSVFLYREMQFSIIYLLERCKNVLRGSFIRFVYKLQPTNIKDMSLLLKSAIQGSTG